MKAAVSLEKEDDDTGGDLERFHRPRGTSRRLSPSSTSRDDRDADAPRSCTTTRRRTTTTATYLAIEIDTYLQALHQDFCGARSGVSLRPWEREERRSITSYAQLGASSWTCHFKWRLVCRCDRGREESTGASMRSSLDV